MSYTREYHSLQELAEDDELDQLCYFDITTAENVLEVAELKGSTVQNRSGTDMDFDVLMENEGKLAVQGYVDGRPKDNDGEWGVIVVSDLILALTDDLTQCVEALKEFINMSVGGGHKEWHNDKPPAIRAHFD